LSPVPPLSQGEGTAIGHAIFIRKLFGSRQSIQNFSAVHSRHNQDDANPELQPAVESDVDSGSGVALKIGRLVSLVPPDTPPRNTKPTTCFRLLVKTGEGQLILDLLNIRF
jgi:hypothetical protein